MKKGFGGGLTFAIMNYFDKKEPNENMDKYDLKQLPEIYFVR